MLHFPGCVYCFAHPLCLDKCIDQGIEEDGVWPISS
uniref:Uncharacterized protein n=1 Tax=Arundo donax TaxID=35708 RepID=A0A0A9FU51_ARUDO